MTHDQEKPEVITIEIRGSNRFLVCKDDRDTGDLCWDEMLGQVAEMTHPDIKEGRYRMRTRAEYDAEEARREAARAARETSQPDHDFDEIEPLKF